MTGGAARILAVIFVLLATVAPARAFDPEVTFHKGTFVLSGEGSYGWQFRNFEPDSRFSRLQFWDAGVRFGLLPLDPVGRDAPLYGALEVGLEPLYQRYTEPDHRFWAGLSAVIRYHFLGLGRVVPYVEVAGSAGGTDLKLPEIRSTFAFLIFGGVGMSVFLDDHIAVYAGYRLQHVSNGNTSKPNRGFESNVAVLGLSYFF
ncbi:MAG TPA: acyloxyacyl hydrolase [Methylomirabilota bacterium]|jgi:opacity protein-like surface antigen|nr:acyloxyacyl hydrolase [Methylomirabilota bacterium]